MNSCRATFSFWFSFGRRTARHGIFATYLRIFDRVCTGMYWSVFRSSGIGGPTTAASSSARERGLKNLNFNCLPRPGGLRIRRKRIVIWEIVDSTTTILEWHCKKKNIFNWTTEKSAVISVQNKYLINWTDYIVQ